MVDDIVVVVFLAPVLVLVLVRLERILQNDVVLVLVLLVEIVLADRDEKQVILHQHHQCLLLFLRFVLDFLINFVVDRHDRDCD